MRKALLVMTGLVVACSSVAMASDLNVWVEATETGTSSESVAPGCEVNYQVFVELGDASNQGLALVGFDLEYSGGDLAQADAPAGMSSFVKPDGLTNPAGYGGTLDAGNLLQVGGGQNTIMNGQVPCASDTDCPAGSTCDVGGTGLCDPVAPFPVGTVVTGIAMPGSAQVVATGTITVPAVEAVYSLSVTNLFANVITSDTTGVPFWATAAATPGTNMPLTLTAVVGGPCPLGGVPEIASTVPPSGAIDARQPHGVNDTIAAGWQSVELTMTQALGTANTADFSLTEIGGDGVPPTITGATLLAGTKIQLDFDAPIEPGAWTKVTHNASDTSTCLGFLPADSNGDRLSNTADIGALIDSINLVPGRILPVYGTDMDRSTVTNGSDILRLIDLLNGAGAFDVWITQSIVPNPCVP